MNLIMKKMQTLILKTSVNNQNMKDCIDLVIVTNEPFPYGAAATNRILTYSSELSKNKRVKVLIVKPTELPSNIINNQVLGVFANIEFKYVNNTTIWPQKSSKVVKGYRLLKGLVLTILNLRSIRPKSIVMAGVSSSSHSLLLRFLIIFFSKIYKIRIYQEMSEYPPIQKKKGISKFYKNVHLKLYCQLDGMIIMTRELSKYFNDLGQPYIFHLPMTVDFKRFDVSLNEAKKSQRFIFKYCGGGNYQRDGLLNMIEAFISLSEKIINVEFHIIGPIVKNSNYYETVMKLIRDKKKQNIIKILGAKKRDEIPFLLAGAHCLIMTPPKKFDSGGFPTKLGEYLASGIPVICTRVSEIPLYLDKTSAILVEPKNHNELVCSMKALVNNYKLYKEIGDNGKKVAKKYFSVESHTENLIKFLKI
jgi:glycosyltransferase involved in cell wall biosynthesis